MQWRVCRVVREVRRWPGAVEYAALLAPVNDTDEADREIRALAYTAMVGEPGVGERVLVNASALLKGLGTGGLAFIVARPDVPVPDPEPSSGHIVKARYTPMQQMLLAVDEQDSPHHPALREATHLYGLPVVVADLHSALPAVLAGLRADHPQARVAYVMTDGGALPSAFSRSVAGLREAGWLAATITVGQAFGGDHEAVSLHTGLLAARAVVDADVAIVIQGPGNVGTGTRWGFSGVACAEALHAAHVLDGRPIATLRVSGADPRERHRGISHHSRTAYGRALLAPAVVPVPVLDPAVVGAELPELISQQAEELALDAVAELSLIPVECDGLLEALAATPVPLSTMGRGLSEDPAAFLAAAVAGRWAGRSLSERP